MYTLFVKIPKTNCFKKEENSVSQIFWGRVKIENAAALYQFHKEGSIQKLIYQLKYEGGKIQEYSQANKQDMQ